MDNKNVTGTNTAGEQNGYASFDWYKNYQKQEKVCPNCGHCPTCGHSRGYQPYPYWPGHTGPWWNNSPYVVWS